MLGGTPRCERCGAAVYHAEQAMGPARKIYHKLCLKCEGCGKRLDSGSLVQHDNMPYCQRCHTHQFGTRDLRHANHHPTASPVASPARAPPPPAPLPPDVARAGGTGPPVPRAVPPPQEYYTPPDLSAAEEPKDVHSRGVTAPTLPARDMDAMIAAGAGSRAPFGVPASASASSVTSEGVTEVTRPNFRNSRPIPAGMPAAASLDSRGVLRRTDSPSSKVGMRPAFEDRCEGCEKRVYAAEQVQAIGKKWHRGCLRCASCKSTIDPSKVSDRDGVPWCKNCYAREHGPGGIAGKR